jgi:GTP-binding protein Era
MTLRSGFVAVVGRPNVGKSTLVNAMVGEKVAITSDRPQTTRHTVRGVVNREDAQLVLVDTPGLHRPRTLLGERLNDEARGTLGEVDVVVMLLPAHQAIGPGDRLIAGEVAAVRGAAKVAVVSQVDRVPREQLANALVAVAELGTAVGVEWDEIVPVSAVDGTNVEVLTSLLIDRLPEGPRYFGDEQTSDEPTDVMVAELIREAALDGVRDELPHSIAVVVEEMQLRPDRPAARPLLDVAAFLYVERDSQRAIVIGRGGSRLREVGAAARTEIERLTGYPVYLDLRVKVAKDWQRDPKQLRRLGF